MTEQMTLQAALEREHRDIDGGIEAYTAGLASGDSDPDPLIRAMNGLRRHIYLEEEFLFPPLKAAGMVMPIFVMLREHGGLWDRMDALDDALARAADAGAMEEACTELLRLLDEHNSKEEPIIYTQADETLDGEAGEELKAFLESGTMPDGWVCERASGAA
ncbi:hemerythrin domain-containing protein [Spelaeicoccus albus]|uniref:Hemerythrin-like domain-containing protein n=1 Tax=Spelaeicoccus albus TaxID=1280376 RepID=A0A7Z0CZ42_9MICO|nr:hemerythrin domain-containing protein [Spelaeicoccus albus]NYI65889.1 hemerythrin-like domain-containing protein [Spelaeicoccus albus]